MQFINHNHYEIFYRLSPLQEILMRKISRKYSNPWLKILVRKDGKDIFKITVEGDYTENEMNFQKAIEQENFERVDKEWARSNRK